jgi:cell division protein FtsN
MARDYKQSKRRRSSRSRSSSRWPWLFGGLVIGFAAGSVVYFISTHSKDTTARTAEKSVAAAPAAAPAAALARKPAASAAKPAEDKDEKPGLDFYKMLPEMEVKITSDALDDARGSPRKAGRQGIYVLQIGSFRSPAEADKLKAQLAFIGVESSIQPVIINNEGTWYRVQSGPYKDLKDLQQPRANLQRNNIDFKLLQLGG